MALPRATYLEEYSPLVSFKRINGEGVYTFAGTIVLRIRLRIHTTNTKETRAEPAWELIDRLNSFSEFAATVLVALSDGYLVRITDVIEVASKMLYTDGVNDLDQEGKTFYE